MKLPFSVKTSVVRPTCDFSKKVLAAHAPVRENMPLLANFIENRQNLVTIHLKPFLAYPGHVCKLVFVNRHVLSNLLQCGVMGNGVSRDLVLS